MKRIISLLLVILLLGTALIGCKKDKEENPANSTPSGSSAEEEFFPVIEKQDAWNGKVFNIMYPMWSLYQRYYFALEQNGELINDANYERQMAIKDYLGVNIVGLPITAEGSTAPIHVVDNNIKKAAMSGEDPYQLVLTHCFVGVAGNIQSGNLLDFGSVKNLTLDQSYWRKDSMEDLSVKGKMYVGSGKFLLYDPCVTVFNKDMLANADTSFKVDDVYQLVRDKKWTIANLKTYASAISADANEGVEAGEGTYGYVCNNEWEISSFMAASNYFVASRDSKGTYVATAFTQTVHDIFVDVKSLFDAPYTYNYVNNSENISGNIVREGRSMFGVMGLMAAMDAISNSDYKIGILPVPATSEGLEVQTLDWAGFMVIPVSVLDPDLSGAVSELLCYYGEKLLYPAFYDKLLGTRTAENYADAEMLDIIFASMVSDPGLAFNATSDNLYQLFYMFSTLIGKNNSDVSSFMNTYVKGASKQLAKVTKVAKK